MPVYQFPGWRRVLFVAVLIVVIVIALAPSISQGTVTLRIYSLFVPSVVSHVFVGFTKVVLHEAGLPNGTGLLTISQGFPNIDLVSPPTQLVPQAIMSTQIHSGRYDAIALVFSNSTLVIAGRSIPVSAPSTINAYLTLPVPPNGIGDVLLVVSFDYSALFASQPSLSLILLQASAV